MQPEHLDRIVEGVQGIARRARESPRRRDGLAAPPRATTIDPGGAITTSCKRRNGRDEADMGWASRPGLAMYTKSWSYTVPFRAIPCSSARPPAR